MTGGTGAPVATPESFRAIADCAPVPMWVTRADGTRDFVNRAYLDFSGLDEEAALAADWRTIIHPDDAPRLLAEALAAQAEVRAVTLEGRFRRADGSWRWLQAVSRPRFDDAGRHIGFVGIAHDVTDNRVAIDAMRDREEQLSAFINQTTAGLAQTDLTGRFTLVNDRFCTIVGRPRIELLGMTMQEITHPDDLPRNLALFERATRHGAPYTHERRTLRPDGSVVWTNNSVAVIRRPDGTPYGVMAVVLDVTARRENEARLTRNEETVRLAMQGAGMATWELDLDVMVGEWSPNRFDLLGYARADSGRAGFDDWLACLHPDDRDMAEGAARRCFADGTPFEIEYRIRRADSGEERWLTSHGSRITYDDGRPPRFVGVSFDITARRHAEESVRAGESRFREIFEQANDYIFTSDLDQRITSGNPAATAALGLPLEQLMGRSFADFLRPGQFDQTSAMLAHKLRHGGTTRHKVDVVTADGRSLAWEVNSRLIHDGAGQPVGLHAIARDVTEAERAQAHQRLLINELNHRVKNTLAIVQSIAQQSFRRDADPVVARRAFEGRLAALAEAHDLLTRENWHSASIATVAAEALAPHDDTGRILLDGPDIRVGPKTAISLALALNELATNALKHGALSRPEGRVRFAWSQVGDDMRMSWVERDGPPVSVPDRRGFGTRMIERGLAAEFGGTVTLDFAADGLRCTIDAPLPTLPA